MKTCNHKLKAELIPDRKGLLFLFIGTFNPEFRTIYEVDYFYGRDTNLFWCILPHSLNESCLIEKGKDEWLEFCNRHKIGITDLVKEVRNFNDLENLKIDKYLDSCTLISNEIEIKRFILKNCQTLRGVFFTRKTSTNIPNMWALWRSIQAYCDALNKNGSRITCKALPTPSQKYAGIRTKIEAYRNAIQESLG